MRTKTISLLPCLCVSTIQFINNRRFQFLIYDDNRIKCPKKGLPLNEVH